MGPEERELRRGTGERLETADEALLHGRPLAIWRKALLVGAITAKARSQRQRDRRRHIGDIAIADPARQAVRRLVAGRVRRIKRRYRPLDAAGRLVVSTCPDRRHPA